MKKNKSKYIQYSICFIFGSLASYITLQYSFFSISLDMNIPEVLMSLMTISVGLYIARNLQNRFTRNQNQYTYLINNLDQLWKNFNDFSEILLYSNNIEPSMLKKQYASLSKSVSFLKNIFNSYGLDIILIDNLESGIDDLFKLLEDKTNVIDNIIDFSNIDAEVKVYITSTNLYLKEILQLVNQ